MRPSPDEGTTLEANQHERTRQNFSFIERQHLMMRFQQHNILSSGSTSRPSARRSSPNVPVVAVVCLLSGYLWGYQSRPEMYPLDMAALLPPPGALQHEASLPPHTPSTAPSNSRHSAQHFHTLDAFAHDYVRQSGLLQSRPPLKPGRSGSSNYTVVPYQILSWYPRIVLYPGFLDQQTTDYIKKLAAPKLEQSSLGVGRFTTEAAGQDVRTSMGAFLSRLDDSSGVLRAIEEKIAAVTLIPPSHGEDFNVLRYEHGQHYHMHMDTFDSKSLRKMDPDFGQRMATIITYLSDVDEGGETVFKKEGRYGAAQAVVGQDDDTVGCKETDFKYKPRQGDAVLFYSLNPDLSVDPRAIHGACPVKGTSEKWVMTKWLHDKPVTVWDVEQGQ